MNSILTQYFITALWSSTDDKGTPLDDTYYFEDIDQASFETQKKELNSFIDLCGPLLDGLDLDDVAHDFWLTRNRHGAGFWDGDYPKALGDKLTELAHSFGECDIYVGDNGKLYFS